MSYWDSFDVYELNILKKILLFIYNDLEIKLDTFIFLINEIDSSIVGRRF